MSTLLDELEPFNATEPSLPLADWLRAEASWYARDDGPVSDLVAEYLGRLAASAEFHRARSVGELVAVEPTLSHVRLDRAAPTFAVFSPVALDLVVEAAGYLRAGCGDAAWLVAWALIDAADRAEDFRAETVVDYWAKLAKWGNDR